ncbi:5-oxopent-3-ene-1,2,5-tricarboxylate decarboxylase / 2-hydroxyhepta-2,4-diene-1,7-dioate isomerase [Candidatus Nanopelagicus abundans]|jgi:2-keto-4-pentenoate hydratase/2-oxohepta-3-ene-1,7-dioic acid hydratase in catechol pathway|uniref:5-oxopent-3-ene-1,2,5-tricarboxylate decarboxylase / 2-hydroxyhepta-2,4-diene-1,7-dioate isomerase n=1 Tax=Candidatus Nanopelagicus abundans TaxID=1884916 RepID=A0A249L4T7_9ACTN|nr:fumarylacetoacetate hydrolase family protein [Candidatus Nanopelagicus abundans]ASY24037.1 5-oxopent-3-ene-1,2,5-tricarboxylate decarboxylase / 2-hydroxyhepta-2,4-diene-1,7-dioate isomerase [Candidatus Nanopelagicus abundans]
MRIIRFSAPEKLGVGTDPLFGVLNDQDAILVLRGDPIYSGIVPAEKSLKLSDVKLLAPVIPRSKVVCIGKNYADHAAEMDSEVPSEPIIFIKPNTSVIGPNEVIIWPRMSERVDYEAELAIVIGRICKEVPASKAKDVIYGYTLANDVTARDLQKKDGQWSRAKGFDTFCPLGPWIETEFIPGNQKITSTLNGEVKQSSMLSEMIFKVPQIIEFVTNVMTLLPGDVILTGTPAGIGPMPSGASITVAIDGLGALTNKVSSRGQ